MRITVLGAGYMGTAMAKVAAKRGHQVRLWGTWLDDPMIEPCLRGEPHPRLKLTVPELEIFHAKDLAAALAGAEMIVHGVNSEGAVPVMTRAAAHLPDVPILSVTKGFLETKAGRMDRIDRVVSEAIRKPLRFVHAAGPAKAMEIARGVITWMTFAGKDAAFCRDAMGGEHMQIGVTDDLAGAEICSAMKNAYATGLGLWDGLVGVDAHNARAACFTQAIVEMRRLVLAGGGLAETVHGAPGVGDLHVTAAGGRNRAFGERVGKGRPAKEVAAEMLAAGELTEGYPAIATAHRWARENGVTDLPFLDALFAVVWENAPVAATISKLRLSV
ncbi:MAG: NAD(P)H-dependent glycerol-3-phosphate dehydrogenase [Polyangiales bacterium]